MSPCCKEYHSVLHTLGTPIEKSAAPQPIASPTRCYNTLPNRYDILGSDAPQYALYHHLLHHLEQNCEKLYHDIKNQGRIQGGLWGPGSPLTTKNEAPAPKFYKIEAPEWQF